MEEELKYKEKFDYVLCDDEKVLWTGSVNKKAYVWKALWKVMLGALLPCFVIMVPSIGMGFTPGVIAAFSVWFLIVLIAIPFCRKDAKNTFLCITNRQIIKRHGIFKNDIQRISINSINELKLITSWIDSDNPISSTLQVTTKGFGSNSAPLALRISSLVHADVAYKLIIKLNDKETANKNN